MTKLSGCHRFFAAAIAFAMSTAAPGQNASPKLYEISGAESRSISAENPTGAKGAGGAATEGWGKSAAKSLGRGWKVSPARQIKAGQSIELADISGNGIIKHIWLTPTGSSWRSLILRVYWDQEEQPSVEVPLGDFFAVGLGEFAQVNSAAVGVNPGAGFNAYWEMPFRKHARITVENRSKDDAGLYYQVDYSVEPISSQAAYFHAQFRNELRTEGTKPYVILRAVRGSGQYVGTYMTYGIR